MMEITGRRKEERKWRKRKYSTRTAQGRASSACWVETLERENKNGVVCRGVFKVGRD